MLKRNINRKLKSTQGTSIFFGLFFFLAASILSIVMLNGALTAVKSVTSDHRAEQNFLTCSSAAKTLRDAITDSSVTQTKKVTYNYWGQKSNETVTWSVTDVSNHSTSNAFAENYLKNWIQNLVENATAGSSEAYDLQIQGPDDMDQVSVKMSVQAEKNDAGYTAYDLTAVLSTGEKSDTCQMSLKMNGQVKSSESRTSSGTSGTTVTTTTTYTWDAPDIIYGTQPRSGEAEQK